MEAPDEQLLELAQRAGESKQRMPTRGTAKRADAREVSVQGSGGMEDGGRGRADGADAKEEGEEAARLAEFKRRHRGARRAWELPPSFPSDAVTQAYTSPRVDDSKEK